MEEPSSTGGDDSESDEGVWLIGELSADVLKISVYTRREENHGRDSFRCALVTVRRDNDFVVTILSESSAHDTTLIHTEQFQSLALKIKL